MSSQAEKFLKIVAILAMACTTTSAAQGQSALRLDQQDGPAALAEEVIENPSEMSGEPAQLPEPQSSEATATQAAPADPNAKPACEPEKKKKPPVNPCTTSHKDPFYNNDFSYLLDPEYTGQCFGDCWKLMPVDDCGEYGTLDVGGQMRLRYHHEVGMGQDRSGVGTRRFENTEHDILLSRLRLYGNWKGDDQTRLSWKASSPT